MKKITVFLIMLTVLLLPVVAKAETNEKKYTSTNLEETFEIEGIELKNKNYKENENQITVYLFRSSACQYTKPLLEYFNSLTEKYGEYFKLRSYDVENQDNMDLYRDIAAFLEKDTLGTPFYVIGETTYLGFNEEEKDVIGQTIVKEYERKDRFDVLEEIEYAKKNEDWNREDSNKEELIEEDESASKTDSSKDKNESASKTDSSKDKNKNLLKKYFLPASVLLIVIIAITRMVVINKKKKKTPLKAKTNENKESKVKNVTKEQILEKVEIKKEQPTNRRENKASKKNNNKNNNETSKKQTSRKNKKNQNKKSSNLTTKSKNKNQKNDDQKKNKRTTKKINRKSDK